MSVNYSSVIGLEVGRFSYHCFPPIGPFDLVKKFQIRTDWLWSVHYRWTSGLRQLVVYKHEPSIDRCKIAMSRYIASNSTMSIEEARQIIDDLEVMTALAS